MNEKSRSKAYADAGVDITAGYKAVELMKKHVARTMLGGRKEDLGGFGGLFPLDITGIKNPVLVSGNNPAQRTWRNTRDRFGKLIF